MGGTHKCIGVNEDGIRLVDENIEDIKATSLK